MMFFENIAVNCVRYVGTMDSILVTGIDWINLKAVAELSRVTITQPMMRRLRLIESLLIKESMENAKRSTNKN